MIWKEVLGYILIGLCLISIWVLYFKYIEYNDDCTKCLADYCPNPIQDMSRYIIN